MQQIRSKSNQQPTAFIAAARNKQGKFMDLIVAESEKLKIGLTCKDKSGKSAYDNWVPDKEFEAFKNAFTQNNLEECKKILSQNIQRLDNFFLQAASKDKNLALNLFEKRAELGLNMSEELLSICKTLYYQEGEKEEKHKKLEIAIKKFDEVAVLMIDKCQDLGLDLNQRFNNWTKDTPLTLACARNKARVVKALLSKAKNQEVDVNGVAEYGWTAFINSCYHGSVESAALLLEEADELKINLNAQDRWKKTGFHYACEDRKRSIVDLIVSKSKELSIDLTIKDHAGRVGHDHLQNLSFE